MLACPHVYVVEQEESLKAVATFLSSLLSCSKARPYIAQHFYMHVQGPRSSPDVETNTRGMSQSVNPPIRLGGNSMIKGKGITVRKMPRNSFKP